MGRGLSFTRYLLSIAVPLVVLTAVMAASWGALFQSQRQKLSLNESTMPVNNSQQLQAVFQGYITAITTDRLYTVEEYQAKFPQAYFNVTHIIDGDTIYPVIQNRLKNGSVIRYVPVLCTSETQYFFYDIDRNQQYKLGLSRALLRLKEPFYNIVGTSRLVYISDTLTNSVLGAHVAYD